MKVQVCVMSDNDVIYKDTAVEIDLEVFPRKGEIVILSKEEISRIVKLIGKNNQSEYKDLLGLFIQGTCWSDYQMEVTNVIHLQGRKAIVQLKVFK